MGERQIYHWQLFISLWPEQKMFIIYKNLMTGNIQYSSDCDLAGTDTKKSCLCSLWNHVASVFTSSVMKNLGF